MKFKDKNIKEKIINILLDILIGLFSIVLVVSIYNTIQIKIFKNSYSNFFGYSVFEVQTNSMSDYINSNDWIIVKITNKIKLKDVVTYEENGEYITHRVIEKYKGTYVTQGDANSAKDEPIDQSQIIGKVVKVLPNFGVLRKTLFNKEVLFVLIITLLVINMMYKKKKVNVHAIVEDEEEPSLVEDNKAIEDDEPIKNILLEDNEPIENRLLDEENDEEVKDELLDKIENNIKNIDSEEDTNSIEPEEEDENIVSIDTTSLELEALETEHNKEIIQEEEARLQAIKEEKQRKLEEQEAEKERIRLEKEEMNKTPELTQITLEKLKEKRKGKKSKNIIDKIMYVKSEQLNEFIELIQDEEKILVNEFSIKNELIKAYIDAKFYDEGSVRQKDSIKRIKKYIKDIAETLSSEYRGKDTKYSEKVDKYKKIFEMIINLECTDFEGYENADINRFYIRTITEYAEGKQWDISKIENIVSNYKEIQKKYVGVIEFLMKNLETDIFELKLNQLDSNKDMYGLALEHNIKFDKIYNEDVIDETYSKGIIAEDKMIVLINLLLIQLIKDMILTNFNKKYILLLPTSIYTKKNKLENILKTIDDKYAKNNIIFLTEYDNLVNNKEIIKKCRLDGYKFGLLLNTDLEKTTGFKNNVYLADYIFIDKDNIKKTKYNQLIPKDILKKVIHEDMTNKIGDLEEEVNE